MDEHKQPIETDGLGRALSWLLGAVGLAGVATLALCAAQRAGSRYPLEWMEGASLQHALWLARGELPYIAPSAELIAYLYPPLAYVPMALASALFGPSLPVARFVSLACTAAAMGLLGVASARLARSRAAGLYSAGLFACGFGYGGAFLDLVRVDACFVLCIAAAVERLSARRDNAALYWLAASALAKQHGAVLLLAVSLALVLRDRKQAVRAVASAWLAPVAACALLQLGSGGWFSRYVLDVPASHALEPWLLLSFVLIDLLVYLPVPVIAACAALIARFRKLEPLDALLVAAIAVSALGRAHPGGDDNVRLPALALLSVMGVVPILAKLRASAGAAVEIGAASGRALRIGLALALCAQAVLLWQPPSLHAPSPITSQRFAMLIDALTRCARGGSAVALDYALLTRTPFIHTMALSDLRLGGDTLLARAGTRALIDALNGPNAPRALAVGERFPELERVLSERYTLCQDLPAPHLPTGYQPGLRVWGEWGDEPRQQVYVLRD